MISNYTFKPFKNINKQIAKEKEAEKKKQLEEEKVF